MMKKTFAATLAASLTFGVSALAADPAPTGTQIVTANLGASYDITVSDVVFSTLVPGTSVDALTTITVNATEDYNVKVQSNKTNMTKWNGTTYTDTTKLASPMSLAVSDTSNEGTEIPGELGTSALMFYTHLGASAGEVLNVTLTQPVSWSDEQLTGGDVYRMVLTYTISGGLI